MQTEEQMSRLRGWNRKKEEQARTQVAGAGEVTEGQVQMRLECEVEVEPASGY